MLMSESIFFSPWFGLEKWVWASTSERCTGWSLQHSHRFFWSIPIGFSSLTNIYEMWALFHNCNQHSLGNFGITCSNRHCIGILRDFLLLSSKDWMEALCPIVGRWTCLWTILPYISNGFPTCPEIHPTLPPFILNSADFLRHSGSLIWSYFF